MGRFYPANDFEDGDSFIQIRLARQLAMQNAKLAIYDRMPSEEWFSKLKRFCFAAFSVGLVLCVELIGALVGAGAWNVILGR